MDLEPLLFPCQWGPSSSGTLPIYKVDGPCPQSRPTVPPVREVLVFFLIPRFLLTLDRVHYRPPRLCVDLCFGSPKGSSTLYTFFPVPFQYTLKLGECTCDTEEVSWTDFL